MARPRPKVLRAIARALRHMIELVRALQHLTVPIAVLLLITVIGTVGYMLLLDVSFIDAAYQSVITLSTVGFSEVVPFSREAKVFTICLVFVGVGAVFYVITMLAATVVEGEVKRNFQERMMKHRIDSMHEHFIVCGFGRVGAEIARMFRDRRRDFVVVDKLEEVVGRATADGCPALVGNAEHEDVLRSTGVERASGLIAATTSDAINTYVTLTARSLNPNIYIVARSEASTSEDKLMLAGANRIISPYKMGARRMALSSLQPMMADYMDALAVGRHGDLLIAELEVEAQSALDGITLVEAFEHNDDTTVLGIRRADQSFLLGPRGSSTLHAGDIVILMAAESDISVVAARAKHG